MPAGSPRPTPYPDVNALLGTFIADVRAILADRFLGLYLSGSLATGEFDEASDIDVLVVTTDALPDETVATLAAMHERLAILAPRWGRELEVSYVPRDAVRRYDPANDLHPRIARGESLRRQAHLREWDTQRHILRERGIVVAGPDPRTLIDPVRPDDLRRAVLATLREWWPMNFQEPAEVQPRGYRSYLVLTGCRLLYTLEHGTVASKPVAAQWAREALDPQWAGLIAWAEAARRDRRPDELDHLREALDFIGYVVERGRRWEPPTVDASGSEAGPPHS